jgi:nitrogen PTS system EIIA component
MNDLSDLISPSALLPRLHVSSKRHVIEVLAQNLSALAALSPIAVFDAVMLRERLAGTGVGEGVAIPHARVEGLIRPIGAFARLEPPGVSFDALDGRSADLVFLLLAPHDRGADHLKALARISRFLRRPEIRTQLRAARTTDSLLNVFQPGLTMSLSS